VDPLSTDELLNVRKAFKNTFQSMVT